ncbi:uncharacterized protein LOC122862907 isoform X2 [Siniperca chuatsi]|uniref:uncharacterized protein LOC122862907 isoform X2 n=1 Tax=Siniperca chuatsi TaxID=119488 RepID=UPI001CE0FDCC|nr:uncharacterized protein LOC122862907 isoform X2 [Siniperca chuatsi]
MMAVCVMSGALLLVMLVGVNYSYPVKQAPRTEPSYPQPSVQREAAASYSSNSFAAPVQSGYVSSSSAGRSSLRPSSTQDIAWAVAPPSLSGEGPPARPSTGQFAPSNSAPQPPDYSNVSPLGLFRPEYQAGEMSHLEKNYEHGNYESETEELGFQPPPPGVQVAAGYASTSQLQPSGLGAIWVEYPYDYMFLTGQYPPGTVSHFSSSFEQGRDHWQDTHYKRDYYPAYPSTQQVLTLPADSQVPQSVKQPSYPAQYWQN